MILIIFVIILNFPKMHISFASLLTVVALAGLTSAKKHDDYKHHGNHGHKEHKPKVPKGKAFDHILQIWFENTVNIH